MKVYGVFYAGWGRSFELDTLFKSKSGAKEWLLVSGVIPYRRHQYIIPTKDGSTKPFDTIYTIRELTVVE